MKSIKQMMKEYEFSNLNGKINSQFWKDVSVISGLIKDRSDSYHPVEKINCYITLQLYLEGQFSLKQFKGIGAYCWANNEDPFNIMRELYQEIVDEVSEVEKRLEEK